MQMTASNWWTWYRNRQRCGSRDQHRAGFMATADQLEQQVRPRQAPASLKYKSVDWRMAGALQCAALSESEVEIPDQRLVSRSQGGTSTGTAKPAFTRSKTTSVLKHLMSGIS